MKTLKLYALVSDPEQPIILSPDPFALEQGDYLCVGSVEQPENVVLIYDENGKEVASWATTEDPWYSEQVTAGEILELRGFYPHPDLGKQVLLTLKTKIEGQTVALAPFARVNPVVSAQLELSVNPVQLSRTLTTLQALTDTCEQADLRYDLDHALELLEMIGDALESQEIEEIPF